MDVSGDIPEDAPSELNMSILPMPDGIAVKPVDESPWLPLINGKSMFIDSKSVPLATSWLNVVVVPFCTSVGKPNVVGTRLALDSAIVAPAMTTSMNKIQITLNLPIRYSLLKSRVCMRP